MTLDDSIYFGLRERTMRRAREPEINLKDHSAAAAKLVPLLAFLTWEWHGQRRGPYKPKDLGAALGLSAITLESYRAALHSLFGEQYSTYFEEVAPDRAWDGAQKHASLRLR